jgi:hypothetical protein
MRTSTLFTSILVLVAATGRAQFKNIRLDDGITQQSGAAIAINLRNPDNIVATAGKGLLYSTMDGGVTWGQKTIASSFKPGNPVLIADRKGTFYHFLLSDSIGAGQTNGQKIDQILCHTSGDGGQSWGSGNPVVFSPLKNQTRPWATVDDKENLYLAWTQFDQYKTEDPNCHSAIMLSRSSNGKKWSKPQQISQTPGDCSDNDNSALGATPAIDADGRTFVSWANQSKIFIDRSFDGNLWLTNDIGVTNQPGGSNFNVPGCAMMGGGMPMLIADRTRTQMRGSLYLLWADQRNGADDTDVWLIRSANHGDYWTSAVKVNNDGGGKHQFLPSMALDQATGYLYVLFYDRRAYDDNQTDVYLAYSINGGSSFVNVKISETQFSPGDEVSTGYATALAAHKGVITPVWTRVDDGKTSIWAAVIKQEDLLTIK